MFDQVFSGIEVFKGDLENEQYKSILQAFREL